MMRTPVEHTTVIRIDANERSVAEDILVTEEPLEIRLGHGPVDDRQEFRLSVTMRTPGNDEELALGFLYTEGLINDAEDVLRVVQCQDVKEEERGNVVRVELAPAVEIDRDRTQRNFYTTSSCGVCGKSSIEAVHVHCSRELTPWDALNEEVLIALPDRMREAQTVFKHTGGIHAAALFNKQGELLLLREDVGRHNAVDKVVGALLGSDLQSSELQLLVSGRAGFELVQKCVVAGIPMMAAVGAPSSLAVKLAKESGLTLVGFLRGPRFNIYSGSGIG